VRVRQSFFSPIPSAVPDLHPRAEPTLSQNVPNPFNPVTEIRYELPSEMPVLLNIYNVSGRRVRTLVNTRQAAGPHHVPWNGRDEDGRRVASGVYFYTLAVPGFTQTRKMVSLK